MNIREIRELIRETIDNHLKEVKTYVVDKSQEALEDEMYDAQGEVQTFLRPSVDGYPEDSYEDLFGDYEHPEVVLMSDIVSDSDIRGIKMMISKQGKYGQEVIDSLKDAMLNGRPIPPVTVLTKQPWKNNFYLISGRHRILAALELGLTHIPVLKMYRRNG